MVARNPSLPIHPSRDADDLFWEILLRQRALESKEEYQDHQMPRIYEILYLGEQA